MHVHTMALGAYQTNCYLAWGEDATSCVVIDPGYEPERVLALAEKLGKRIDAVLLTHGHFDHVGGVEAIIRATGCKLWMREADYTQHKTRENDFLYPIHDCDFTEVQLCEEGDVIRLGGLALTVMETPGHTWGSVCYLCEDTIFSGDTLFQGSCGRTDLPGGDGRTLMESLARLGELEGDFVVRPGHGPATTLAEEKRYNPYMRN